MKQWRGRIVLLVTILLVSLGIAWLLWPQPVPVELAAVVRGPLQVTVDDDGQTRVRDRYIVAAPLAGLLQRITLDPGDPVQAHETVLAVIEPEDPALLDVRTVAQAEARVRAASATVAQAQANVQRAAASLELAQSEYERLRMLIEQNAATTREVNDARLLVEMRAREREAAEHNLDVARFEREQAEAALLYVRPQANGQPSPTGAFRIHSPIDGQVLRVHQESATFIAAGARLIEVGDPSEIEVEVDVLSSAAVNIRRGADVWLEGWGGDQPLRAVVRIVEPSGFTKVSALGVEEQRVFVIADIVDPHDDRQTLGDGYRVDARIVIWQDDDVLLVPTSALFRVGDRWHVFVEEAGRARSRQVEIGRQTALQAQVLAGLELGQRVITYPSDDVRDLVRIAERTVAP